jgi:hypothetical protein
MNCNPRAHGWRHRLRQYHRHGFATADHPRLHPAVYVFAGANANPVDLNNSAPPATQPVTESAVTLNNTTGNYDFTAAFLPAGTYTLAFTCEAAQDNPAVANTISFTSVGAAPAVAGQTILVNLH